MILKKNDVHEVEITDMTEDGKGIGRIDGVVVFVPRLIPGELANVRIIKVTKRYAVGRLEEIIRKSIERLEPPCPVFSRCGGCTLMHMTYAKQLEHKKKRVVDCMQRIAGVDVDVSKILPSSKEWEYRNKTSLPVRMQEDIKIGCFAERSHEVIEPPRCLLYSKRMNSAIDIVREWMKSNMINAYDEQRGLVRHVVVRETSIGELMVALVINHDKIPSETLLIEALQKGVNPDSILLNINKENTNVILGTETRVIYGKESIMEEVCGLKFKLSLESFFQVNTPQASAMYQEVFRLADIKSDDVVLDLFCGVGTMTLLATRYAKSVIGVEVERRAVEDARENAVINGITNASFICEACENLKLQENPNVIIVDPPRKGLLKEALDLIVHSSADKLVYVSCDPATLARDIALLVEGGFCVREVVAADMFPQTGHVETVCLLSKLKSNHHIEVNLNMDELDLTSAESKATYEEIKEYVLENSGFKVSSLYIGQVKEKMGIKERENYNISKKEDAKVPKCPADKEKVIIAALKHFSMID